MTAETTFTGRTAIIGADRHPHAARRLREAFPGVGWIDLPAGATAEGPAVEFRLDPALVEGGFRIDVAGGDAPRMTVSGGPFSGVIYGVEEVIGRTGTPLPDGLRVATGTVEDQPGLPYRTFWNWDHTTNWNIEQVGIQEIGVMNPYAKPADGFLDDFRRMVDFMSQHRISAVTIYGFLRESHGGIEAAQELCRYATERGVRILPGVAINAYGGVIWEMDHEFNLATWLRKHPELAAQMERPPGFQISDLGFDLYFPRGDYSTRGCPSHPENQQWMEDGIAWLAETFEIGGINIEAGDYGVCGCPLCQRRRAEREDARRREGYAESWSHADMADFYPRLYDAALRRRPDAWIYSEIQWDNLLDSEAMEPLRSLPDGGIYQHTFNRTYSQRAQRELGPGFAESLPTKRNVIRLQYACQWNGDRRTERYRFNGRDFAEMAWLADTIGFDGLTGWGEPSPFEVPVELGYLAFARFQWDPKLTWERWVAEDLAPRLGGDAAATRYLELVTGLYDDPRMDDAALRRMQGEALEGARSTDDGVARRWLWLADRVARRRFNGPVRPIDRTGRS